MAVEPADAVLLSRAAAALGLGADHPPTFTGPASFRSVYPVTDLAVATVGATGAAVAGLLAALGLGEAAVTVRRDLAEAWFRSAIRPDGWKPPAPWDPVAGDYATADGWIRLHTNAPAHRAAALTVLGVPAEPEAVATAVAGWAAQDLEDAVVAAGGAAAAMRSAAAWARHEQGAAVAAEPLVARAATDVDTDRSGWAPSRERPLTGLRVLDLTRVLAGPVATRLLAGLGAQVLRIDPPGWDEPAVVPDMTLGKRLARLDARTPEGLTRLTELLAQADVLVHGYRADALERLGLGEAVRRAVRPGLVDVSLDAYGHTGPWATRRGFDSLVQMSAGIAETGMRDAGADRPVPLPVQALDHATGWLTAAAVLVGLADRVRDGRGSRARLSLARTAAELEAARDLPRGTAPGEALRPSDLPGSPITTPWGAASLIDPPLTIEGVRIAWDLPPRELGSDGPTFTLQT